MANVLVNDASLADIADAIREKNGTEETYKPAEMGAAVRAIESGGGVGIILSDFTTDGYNLPQVAAMIGLTFPEEDVQRAYLNRFVKMFANASKNIGMGYWQSLRDIYLPNGIKYLSGEMFQHCISLENLYGDLESVTTIGTNTFQNCENLKTIPYMPNLYDIGINAFNSSGLTEIKLYKKPTSLSLPFNNCLSLLDIYVPWAEGEVEGAPWGATNATIHYNTVYAENHEPIV